MKKLYLFICIISLAFSQDSKLAVSILDFKGVDVEPKLLKACFSKLETSLIQSNRFTVIEKGQRDEILKEQRVQSSGICDEACAVEIGQLVGAEYLMLGNIIDLGGLYQIDIKIVDIEKGDVAQKVTREIEGKLKELLNGMEEASREIVRRIASGSDVPIMNQQGGILLQEKSYGQIEVESNPSGAVIMIDGVDKGFTPKLVDQIQVGTRSLMLIKPGYETLKKGVVVIKDKLSIISEVLIPKSGGITILSEPIGAIIYLNDEPKGKTPFSLDRLPINEYIVRLELENYELVTKRVTIQYNENITQKFELKPSPGFINLIASPAGATIKIEKRKYKTSKSGITKIPMKIGKYKVNLDKKGYESQSKSVIVEPGQSVALEMNLVKLPSGVSSNPDMGFLNVKNNIKGSKLKILGTGKVQDLPLEYFELKYGNYRLKSFMKGYESKSLTIDIVKQKTTNVEINLNKKLKSKALRYSVYFPGGGQLYAGHFQRSLIYALTTIGMSAMVGQSIANYSSDKDLMNQYYADYESASTSDKINQTWASYNDQVLTVNETKNKLILFSSALIGTWLINILDVYYYSAL